MNKFAKIFIIGLGVLGTVVLLRLAVEHWLFAPQVPLGSETIPTKILIEQKSPHDELIAQILEGEKIEGFDMLGSNERVYLKLKYPNSEHLVLRDLSEGFGSYEGGIFGLKWLDENRVYIDRVVGDQEADLVYDLNEHRWQEVENK